MAPSWASFGAYGTGHALCGHHRDATLMSFDRTSCEPGPRLAGRAHTVFFKWCCRSFCRGLFRERFLRSSRRFDEVIVILFIGGPNSVRCRARCLPASAKQVIPHHHRCGKRADCFQLLLVTVEPLRRGDACAELRLSAALEVHGKRRCRFRQAGGLCISLHEICGTGRSSAASDWPIWFDMSVRGCDGRKRRPMGAVSAKLRTFRRALEQAPARLSSLVNENSSTIRDLIVINSHSTN